jgi:hypothetical protein
MSTAIQLPRLSFIFSTSLEELEGTSRWCPHFTKQQQFPHSQASNLFNVFIRQDDLQILHPPKAKQQKPLATKENGQV